MDSPTETMQKLGPQIASHFPELEYKPAPGREGEPTNRAELIHRSKPGYGFNLRIYHKCGQNRLQVYPLWPRIKDEVGTYTFSPMYENIHSITIAAKRGAKTIAHDIRRRFLQVYDPQYEEQFQAMEEALARNEREERVTQELAEILDTKDVRPPSPVNSSGGQVNRQLPGESWSRLIARISGYEGISVNMELHNIPESLACEIAAVVRNHTLQQRFVE